MEINLLVLNLGNTRLAVGVFIAGALEYVARLPIDNRTDWPAQISEAWDRVKDKEDVTVVGASVNPPLTEHVEQVVARVVGQKVLWVGSDIDLPIKVKTDSPEQTGIDRVLNVAAAYEQIGKACVVVDAGSAVTVNLCNDAGDFVGGAIAPGAAMQLEALNLRTAKLPRVVLETPTDFVGRSTEQAIRHGVFHGIRGLVRELTEQYATELGTWPDVIATGGDAPVLFEGWEVIHAVAPDLTLYGIALAYTEHHIKRST